MSRILLVEENVHLQRVYQLWLGRPDWETVSAGTVQQAEELAQEDGPFDLLLVDFGLPDGNGWDLAQKLMSQHGIPQLIVMSASNFYTLRRQRESIAAESFLGKPFSQQDLVDRVTAALNNLDPN